jgi:CheY-like chemotaxis protein
MSETPAVLIAPSQHIDGLKERAKVNGELLAFEDTHTLQALQAIAQHRPALVVLERLFAATPRGAALINRIKQDPQLAHTEIRVIAHDSNHTRTVFRGEAAGPAARPAAVVEAPDYRGTRRAKRFRLKNGVELLVDGNPASVIEMSAMGAQVVLSQQLRPYQRVRVVVGQDQDVYRCTAAIAWSRYELPRGKAGGHYRVGLEFNDPDTDRLEAFCRRHEQSS